MHFKVTTVRHYADVSSKQAYTLAPVVDERPSGWLESGDWELAVWKSFSARVNSDLEMKVNGKSIQYLKTSGLRIYTKHSNCHGSDFEIACRATHEAKAIL